MEHVKTSKFFDRKQLGERWKISTSTIKRMEERGELKPVRLGPRLLRYREEDILRIEATR